MGEASGIPTGPEGMGTQFNARNVDDHRIYLSDNAGTTILTVRSAFLMLTSFLVIASGFIKAFFRTMSLAPPFGLIICR